MYDFDFFVRYHQRILQSCTDACVRVKMAYNKVFEYSVYSKMRTPIFRITRELEKLIRGTLNSEKSTYV